VQGFGEFHGIKYILRLLRWRWEREGDWEDGMAGCFLKRFLGQGEVAEVA